MTQQDFFFPPEVYVVLSVWEDESSIQVHRDRTEAIDYAVQTWQSIMDCRFEGEDEDERNTLYDDCIINENDNWRRKLLPMHAYLAEDYYDSVTVNKMKVH